jgi:hypothetical protein
VERESDKHNPRLDEEMKKEAQSFTQGSPVDSRAQESREKEPPADGEPTPDEVVSTTVVGGEGLTHDELEARQDLARYIEGSIFPASREAIIADAEAMGAPEHVVTRLAQLPEGRYDGFPDVWKAVARSRS